MEINCQRKEISYTMTHNAESTLLPAIDMDELKSIMEFDNGTMGTIAHLVDSGSQSALVETELMLAQQYGIVSVMSATGFLDAMWNAYVSLSGNEQLTAADREAFTWATANAFQRGFMACSRIGKLQSTQIFRWVN